MSKFVFVVFFFMVNSFTLGQNVEVCGNFQDDDADGFTDCDDPDCSTPYFKTPLGDLGSCFGFALGDFNSDSFLDAFLVRYNNRNRVALGSGTGSMILNEQDFDQFNYHSYDVAVGDLDGDGHLDAFVANDLSTPDAVFVNNGEGGFTRSNQSLSNKSSKSVFLGDIDNDGDLDAIVGSDSDTMLWLNDGLGGFSSSQIVRPGPCQSVVLFDADGDGFLDAYLGGSSAVNSEIFFNDGIGNLVNSGQELESVAATNPMLGVSIGDLNSDTHLDLVVTGGSFNSSTVWLNDGTGYFYEEVQSFNPSPVGALKSDVELIDFDDDGDLDAITAPSLRFWINDGCGSFALAQEIPELSYQSVEIASGDLDQDGDIDLVYSDPNGQVFLFNTAGQFIYNDSFTEATYSYNSNVSDLDGDGDVDIWIACDGNSSSRILLNNGSGEFQITQEFDQDICSTSVELLDFDGDGDNDAFVSGSCGQGSQFYINVGQGFFVDSGQVLGGQNFMQSQCAGAGDFDGDGDLDVFIANNLSPDLVFLNDGIGGFSDSGQELGGSLASSDVEIADVDNDGDIDAVVSHQGGCLVYVNDGSGSFATSIDLVDVGPSSYVNLGDADGDGFVDILVGGKLFYNESGTLFIEDFNLGAYMDFVDIDSDGDLDIFNFGDTGRIFINDGIGQFEEYSFGLWGHGGASLRNSRFADFDGDGDDDLLLLFYSARDRLYLNPLNCIGDIDLDGIPNECDVDWTVGEDCDSNGQDDFCQNDQDGDGVIDPCDGDVDGDGIPNNCDLDLGGEDCNLNGIADNCDADLNSDEIPDDCQDPLFRRGDPNGDGAMDIGDGVTVLGYLFGSTSIDCFDAGDSNDDGNLNIADAITILSALFTGGDAPPEPGPASCDLDPTTDSLGCESYENCS